MRTSLFVSLVLASAVGLAGAAQATVYDLTLDHCTGGCGPQAPDFGTVTTSDDADGMGMDVTVSLLNDDSFTSGGTHAFVFDLTGAPTITLAKLTSGFTFEPAAGGPYHEDGFGDWPYAIDFTSGKGGDNEQTSLSFEVLGDGTNLANFTGVFDTTDSKTVDFAADIWSGTDGKTGDVGAAALAVASVPEPATWALMLIGVGGLGAALRGSRSRIGVLPA
jgi:hypothetical protein